MDKIMIKKAVDREIEKACVLKSIDFSSLTLDDGFNLLSSGIFDSLGVLQLIMSLESELNAEIDLSEHAPSDFTNYSKLIEILEMSRLVEG